MQNNMLNESIESDSLPTERIVMVAWALAHGRGLSTLDVARLTGLTRFGAYKLLCKASRVIPIYCNEGVWRKL